MQKSHFSKSELLFWDLNQDAKFERCSSESKCIEECESSAKQLFSKYREVFQKRINDYIGKYFFNHYKSYFPIFAKSFSDYSLRSIKIRGSFH